MVTILVAWDRNRLIGKGNALPWKVPEEMEYFRRTTDGGAVIMGRRTWESIPNRYKPLVNRSNIVLSRSVSMLHPAVTICDDLSSAISKANHMDLSNDTFIIGGAAVYAEAISNYKVDRILASEIDGTFQGDVYFPALPDQWHLFAEKQHEMFRVLEYRRN